MVVDEQGRFVSADLLIGLLGPSTSGCTPTGARGRSRVVSYDIRSSRGVVEELERLGAEPRMCRVGHSFAKQLLRETQGIMGGELAGHYYFRENYFCDSAFIAALVLLAVLSAGGRPLSEVVAEIGRYAFSGEINFAVARARDIVEAVAPRVPRGGSSPTSTASASTSPRGGSTCARPTPSRCCASSWRRARPPSSRA